MTTTNAIRESGSIQYLDLSDQVRAGLKRIFELDATRVKEAAEQPMEMLDDLEDVVWRAQRLIALWNAADCGRISLKDARSVVASVTEERDYCLQQIVTDLEHRKLYVDGDEGWGYGGPGSDFESSLQNYASEISDYLVQANRCDAFLRLVADAERKAA